MTAPRSPLADLVVVGEVAEVTPPPARDVIGSSDPVGYTVGVDRVLKGESAAAVEVLSARMGASCGLEGIEAGREYVVFAAHEDVEGEPTREPWASLCGGNAPASRSYVAAVEAVTGEGTPPVPTWALGGALAVGAAVGVAVGVAVGLLVLLARRTPSAG